MPILAKGEELLDSDDKKAKRAVILSIVSDTPSSYLSEAHASIGRTRFFMRRRRRSANTAGTTAPSPIPDASDSACPARRDSLRAKSSHHYLEERNHFFFPSSGPIQLSRGGSVQASVEGLQPRADSKCRSCSRDCFPQNTQIETCHIFLLESEYLRNSVRWRNQCHVSYLGDRLNLG